MDRLVEARDLGALVAGLYSAGVQLALSDDGKRVGVVGDVGPGMEEALKANKEKLLEMLTGDPLSWSRLGGQVCTLQAGPPVARRKDPGGSQKEGHGRPVQAGRDRRSKRSVGETRRDVRGVQDGSEGVYRGGFTGDEGGTVSLQYLAWAVLSVWQFGPASWRKYAPAVVVLAAGSETQGTPSDDPRLCRNNALWRPLYGVR